MREIHTDYTRVAKPSARVQIVLDFDELATKDEVIAALGSAAGKALTQITEDFAQRD